MSSNGVRLPPHLAAVPRENIEEFDHVVVGSGVAGTVLAARLAEAGHRVCLLEQGGPDVSLSSRIPAEFSEAAEDPAQGMRYWVSHYQDPAQAARDPNFVPGHGIDYPRGQGLGGSSNDHAQVAIAPPPSLLRALHEASGNDPRWAPERLNALRMEKVESVDHRPVLRFLDLLGRKLGIRGFQNLGGHGYDRGNYQHLRQADARLLLRDPQLLKTVAITALSATRDAVRAQPTPLRKARELVVQARRAFRFFDPNDWRDLSRGREGFVLLPYAATPTGRRSGPRDLLLDVQRRFPGNLTIKTGHQVDTVELNAAGDRAVAVRARVGNNLDPASLGARDAQAPQTVEIRARQKVFVSAGTIGSAAILQRSGVGPRDVLEHAGVEVKSENPHVGVGLQDRYEKCVVVKTPEDFRLLHSLVDGSGQKEWLAKGTGPLAANGFTLCMLRKSDPSLEEPDTVILGGPFAFDGFHPGFGPEELAEHDKMSWIILQAKTHNPSGTVAIHSADPSEQPEVAFNYFQEGEAKDLPPIVSAFKRVRAYDQQLGFTEVTPGDAVQSDEQIARSIKDDSYGHHLWGTARLGQATSADGSLKGIPNLVMGDASLFPDNPGYFPFLPLEVLGENLAQIHLADAGQPSGTTRPSPSPSREGLTGRRKAVGGFALGMDAFAGNHDGVPTRSEGAPGWLSRLLRPGWRRRENELADRLNAEQVAVSPEASELLPPGQLQHYRLTKLSQAAQMGRPVTDLTEGRVVSRGVQIDPPQGGPTRLVDHDSFFQQLNPPAGVKTKGVVIAFSSYEATGRSWTQEADALSREGYVVLTPDHPAAGYSKGEAGVLDAELYVTQVGSLLAYADGLRKQLGLSSRLRIAGESYGAGAALSAVVLAHAGKLRVPGGEIPRDVYLPLHNPFLGNFKNPLFRAVGKLTSKLPFAIPPVPSQALVTRVYREKAAAARYDATARNEDIRVVPTTIVSGDAHFAALLTQLESGALCLPADARVGILRSSDDTSLSHGEVERLERLLGGSLVKQQMFASQDHALTLNPRAVPALVELIGAAEGDG